MTLQLIELSGAQANGHTCWFEKNFGVSRAGRDTLLVCAVLGVAVEDSACSDEVPCCRKSPPKLTEVDTDPACTVEQFAFMQRGYISDLLDGLVPVQRDLLLAKLVYSRQEG